MIEVKNLTKSFEKARGESVRALDGVSLSCRPGEVFGIIGPNGAGKTTLLRVLSTLILPTSGTATIAGHDILTDADAVRESIGFVSPSHGLYDTMTVRENVRYFGLLSGVPKQDIDAVIQDVMVALSIADQANVLCKKLSTGIRQRVSIARAIVHQPPVLFFDEPTNGLDVPSSRVILDFIRTCRKEGQVVVFCSHIMEHVADVSDRIAVMEQGKVVAVDTLDGMRERTGRERLDDIYLAMTK